MAAQKTALVADADEFLRTALGHILRQELGFSDVLEADNLDDVYELMGQGADPALLVIEAEVLKEDMFGRLRALRDCFPELLLVVVSSSRSRGAILMALDAGVNAYVLKEDGVSGFQSALSQVFAGSIYVPSALARPTGDEEPAPEKAAGWRALGGLSTRQQEVLALVVAGKSNKEIARALNLGEGTIKVHMSALFRALQVHSRSAAAAMGAKLLDDDACAA